VHTNVILILNDERITQNQKRKNVAANDTKSNYIASKLYAPHKQYTHTTIIYSNIVIV